MAREVGMSETIRISIDNKRSLLDQIRERTYYMPSYCGGRGACGKCQVRFLKDPPPATEADRRFLSADRLSDGWRLACKVNAEGTCELEIADQEEGPIQAADSFVPEAEGKKNQAAEERPSSLAGDQVDCAMAVDIGTTTIVAGLIDVNNNMTLKTASCVNHQRSYGADVLSRIDASNRGEGEELQKSLFRDLSTLCRLLGIGEDVEKVPMPVIISGNTTMEHLLQGLSCRGLGVFPFTPVDLSMHNYKNMIILPGISTYVGADIVSGIAACGIDQDPEVSILVDLGTNGEMVIGNKDRILVASTAAGPAFEGGNISCGMAGVPGAIDTVEINKGVARISTIGDREAAGICGSGILDLVYELRKEKIIDETGLLEDKYFDLGYPLAPGIRFTVKDVREVQMAKSAIRAGIEILLDSYGISCQNVNRLYLAGGFGQKINSKKAVGIGLLPEELAGRITAVGNSSLEGAKMLAVDSALSKRFEHIREISEEILLSEHKLFYNFYVEHMNFDG